MGVVAALSKKSPRLAEGIIDAIHYFPYKRRIKAKPEDYPKILMKDWVKRTKEEPFDLSNPQTYRQKIQWSKIYDRDERRTLLSDKVEAKNIVAGIIGEAYIIPTLGVYQSPDEIDFDKLPDRFVIKMNHSSGMNIIVKDKSLADIKEIKRKLRKWLKINFAFYNGLELQYAPIVPKILIEQYMEDEYGELRDYKFLCFDGRPHFCWVDTGRFSGHYRNVYDMEWNLEPWMQMYPNSPYEVSKPEGFEKMAELAEKLSRGFAHVRVDLFYAGGKIYFGEMTFTSGNGTERITPPEYDKVLGDLWKIEK